MALRAAALRQRLVDTRGARPTTPRDLRRLAFNRQAIDAGLNLRHTANNVQRAAATISRIVSFGDRLAGRATRGYVHWYRTSRERPVLTASPAAGGPGPSECPQIQCSRGESSIASFWLHLDSSRGATTRGTAAFGGREELAVRAERVLAKVRRQFQALRRPLVAPSSLRAILSEERHRDGPTGSAPAGGTVWSGGVVAALAASRWSVARRREWGSALAVFLRSSALISSMRAWA